MATARQPGKKQYGRTRQTDAKARVTLPKQFADSLVEIELVNDFELRIRKVVTIPEREAWLWKNSKPVGAVMIGLAEARAKDLVDGPDVAADLASLGDED